MSVSRDYCDGDDKDHRLDEARKCMSHEERCGVEKKGDAGLRRGKRISVLYIKRQTLAFTPRHRIVLPYIPESPIPMPCRAAVIYVRLEIPSHFVEHRKAAQHTCRVGRKGKSWRRSHVSHSQPFAWREVQPAFGSCILLGSQSSTALPWHD